MLLFLGVMNYCHLHIVDVYVFNANLNVETVGEAAVKHSATEFLVSWFLMLD